MNANDFRELALGFDDAEESAHMGAADFRVGGRIFATLAHGHLGLGNLMLSPELQQSLIDEAPDVFFPVSGGWGRMGATHVRLAERGSPALLMIQKRRCDIAPRVPAAGLIPPGGISCSCSSC